MSPPKNGSLGRGLGDLLGGVPETIGVAGAPPPPPPPRAEPFVSVKVNPAPQGEGNSSAETRRLIGEFTVGLILFLTGILLGFWAAQN